jgi:hypothetical protein
MTKFLRLLAVVAVLLLAVTFSTVPTATAAQFIPKCYSGLPYSPYPDPSWTYSHQCYQGSYIEYVYIDARGNWHLTSSTVLP